MGAFLIFLLAIIVLIIFIAYSLINSILGGIANFFGIGSKRRRYYSNRGGYSEEESQQYSSRSEESVKRMRKFKNTAEDADFEIIEN